MTEPGASLSELSTLEYRLEEYEALLSALQDAGYEFRRFDAPQADADETPESAETRTSDESLAADETSESKAVFLRHDVDLSVDRALAMAEVEYDLGVASTYCFLLTTPVYDLKLPETVRALERIAELGHDVGLHFDTHRYWDEEPDPGRLAARVTDELAVLNRLVDDEVSTVSFHVPPRWVLGRDFDAFTNAYAPRFFEGIEYRSDSSQKWLDERPFPGGPPETFQLLVHPGLWHAEARPMDEIVDELRRETYRRVDAYLDPLGE